MTAYGEALARYRDEAGLNQRELGAAIGLDPTQVNKIERGHRPPLGAKYVKTLVRALRLSRSEAENLVVDLGGLSRKMLDFMDEVEEGEAAEEEDQAVDTALPSVARSAMTLSPLVLEAAFEQIETVFESKHFSKEQMKRAATELVESANQIARLIKPQPEK
jgi:transcriptional regulator with XRE-family HTH domain